MVADTPPLRAARLFLLGAALAGLAPAARGEEAVDADGRATPGVLTLDGGRLHFTPKDPTRSLSLDAVAFIRFPVASADPCRVGFVRRLVLPNGQHVTGRLLAADDDAVVLRTAWADRLEAPRSAVVALRQPPGRLSVFEDDFGDGLKAWSVSGKPTVAGDPPGVRLSEPGQSLTYTPAQPPEAGRLGVNFRDRDAAGGRWLAELQFQGEGKVHTLHLTLAGPGDAYEVQPTATGGDARRVLRSPGWHRLEVRFSRDSLGVLCDDAVLWSDLRQGPGGALRRISLSCVEAAKSGERRGDVEFAEFALTRAADEPPRPPGDAGQDEVWLADGDQLFGAVRRVNHRTIEIEGPFGKRALSWADLRGCWFKHGTPPAGAGHVRVWIDNGLDPEPDVLDGVVKALDDKRLVLKHPSLGELVIPRERLRRVRPPDGRDS